MPVELKIQDHEIEARRNVYEQFEKLVFSEMRFNNKNDIGGRFLANLEEIEGTIQGLSYEEESLALSYLLVKNIYSKYSYEASLLNRD